MPVFFVMSSPHSAQWHVSLAITSCDIVIAHHVRVMVVVVAMVMMRMVGMGMEMEMVMGMVMGMVVAVMMIARLVMLNVVKHLYQVNIPPLSTD